MIPCRKNSLPPPQRRRSSSPGAPAFLGCGLADVSAGRRSFPFVLPGFRPGRTALLRPAGPGYHDICLLALRRRLPRPGAADASYTRGLRPVPRRPRAFPHLCPFRQRLFAYPELLCRAGRRRHGNFPHFRPGGKEPAAGCRPVGNGGAVLNRSVPPRG